MATFALLIFAFTIGTVSAAVLIDQLLERHYRGLRRKTSRSHREKLSQADAFLSPAKMRQQAARNERDGFGYYAA